MTATMSAVVPRAEVPFEETWALETVYPDNAAAQRDYDKIVAMLPEIEQFKGKLGDNPATLLAALQQGDELNIIAYRYITVAQLRRAEDATNPESAAFADKAMGLAARAGAATAFMSPEIAAIPAETLTGWYAQEPGLEQYRFAIEMIQRLTPHLRSPEVEQVIAQTGDAFSMFETTHDMLENGELPLGVVRTAGGEIRIAQGNLDKLLHSADRDIRKQAWEQSSDAYLAYKGTFAAALTGAIKRDVFQARAHNFNSSLEASLAGDNIAPAVFHNLVDTVWEHFPIWHRYFAARRKLLGLAEGDLHGYDLEAPLAARQPEMSWQRGGEIILDSLAPLGATYVETVRQGLAERWVDRCANLGKGGGAFSSGAYDTAPFISMTWQNNLSSVSTLTHELGHSMHSFLANKHQPITYADYGMSAAETASNFNQALMGSYLLAENDERDWTLAVIEERMENFQRYLFIMPILARFELAAHERVEAGEALGAEWMNQTLLGFYQEGYGDEVVIDPDRIGITWARFPHLFMNFYVFQYGVGISAAAALSLAILAGDETARDRYLQFLASGGSKYPIDALRDAGIDMTSPEPIRQAFKVLEGYVEKLEALVG